jgi:hypothetical protein
MPAGRPLKIDKDTLAKLEAAFLLGCTDLEACFAADIHSATLYRYIEANPEFSDRKEALKQNPVYKSRKVLIDALDDNDVATAHKIIDRKEGSKLNLVGPVQITLAGKDACV